MPEMHLETRKKGLKGGGAFIWFCCGLCKTQENGRKMFCCLDQKKTENEKGLFKQIKDIYLSFFSLKINILLKPNVSKTRKTLFKLETLSK